MNNMNDNDKSDKEKMFILRNARSLYECYYGINPEDLQTTKEIKKIIEDLEIKNPPIDFDELIDAVEENNDINDGEWADWESCAHMESVYGKLECDYVEVVRVFVNSVIRNNGENLNTFKAAYCALQYGVVFSRI